MVSDDRPQSLRDENRERTRRRIVEATADLVREQGRADFTMPEVAARSGIALRTLYRYFPQRQELVDALAEVADQTMALSLPSSVDEIDDWLATAWRNLLAEEALLRAQHDGPAGAEIRRTRARLHRRVTEALIDEAKPGLSAEDRADIVDVALLVSSSTALFEHLDVLDVEPERGARLAAKTIRALLAATDPS